MHNTIAYPTQQSSSPSRGIPCSHNEEMTTESQRYNCFIRNGGNAIPKQGGPEVKGSNPTTGFTLLWYHGVYVTPVLFDSRFFLKLS